MSDTAHTEHFSVDDGVESLLRQTTVAEPPPVEEAQVEEEQSASEIESEEVPVVEDEAESGVTDEVEDDDSTEEEAEELYVVKVNGKEQEVPLRTLLQNYRLQQTLDEGFSNLNRQKESVAEQLTEAQQQAAQNQEVRERYIQVLSEYERRLSEVDEPPAELRETDPLKYQELEIEALKAQEQARKFAAERDRVQAEQLAERKRIETPLLLKAIPEWNDPEVAKRMLDLGYSLGTDVDSWMQEMPQTFTLQQEQRTAH